MGRGISGAVLRGLGAEERELRVLGRRDIAPHMVRVDVESEGLLHPGGEHPGSWIRIWFPDPRGGSREHQRGYTIVDADPATGRFSIDFVVHEPAGPAAIWARTCEPGDVVVAQRYGDRPIDLGAPAAGWLLVGDLAGLPAIRAVAEAIPAGTPVRVLLESRDERDALVPLPEGPDIDVEWIPASPKGRDIGAVVDAGDWDGWRVWVTAETATTRAVRQALRKRHGLDRDHVHSQAYWVRGRGMGVDRG
ncbi:siderophore-interacting protein [Corynebacterium sp. 335C]